MMRLIRNRTAIRALAVVVMALLLVTLAHGLTFAQTTTHKLNIGDTVNGSLDAKTFAQVYAFDAAKGDSITITATAKTKGLLLALLLSDSSGQAINQVAELTRPDVTIRDFKPSQDGTYYVTVLRATGVQGNTAATFTLSLSGAVTNTNVAQATLTTGMSIQLSWASTDFMSLEVRDPVGGAVNLNTPSIASGGQLDAGANVDCANATATNPSQTASWPKGAVPAGSYEILVYFKQSCAQGVTPLPFAVTITVDGKAQDPIRGELAAAGQVYVLSFQLSAPDTVQVRPGGPNLGFDLSPLATKIAAPTSITTRLSATGTIKAANPGDTYSFTAKQGTIVSISMNAVKGGSLDPLLILLDSSGNVVTSNDDANPNTRDSLISNFQLPADGTYTIVATRYALAIGGTEGDYQLKVTLGKINAPTNATAAPAATGAATAAATSALVAGQPGGSIEASLTWNTRADLRLWIRDPQGRALYADVPRIDSGGILTQTANLACKTTTATNPQDYSYWNTPTAPAGTYEVRVWENSNCNDTAPVSFTLKVSVRATVGAPAKEILTATDSPGANKQSFLTTFTVNSDGSATPGASGQVTGVFHPDVSKLIQSAPALSYNQTTSGQITNVSDTTKFALYTFNAIAGDKIQITMIHKSGTLDTELYLFSVDTANGNALTQLQFNNGNTTDATLGPLDSRINYTITKDGTYLIVATHYGVELGATTGTYDLKLTGPTR
ncbi:MAG: pre-peptidase C-terminal domain-containing protein [Aggregatilineales bacterium]